MNIVRNDALRELVRVAYEEVTDANLKTTSTMLRPNQLVMIQKLARANRLSQGDILRIILDEWCNYKLNE